MAFVAQAQAPTQAQEEATAQPSAEASPQAQHLAAAAQAEQPSLHTAASPVPDVRAAELAAGVQSPPLNVHTERQELITAWRGLPGGEPALQPPLAAHELARGPDVTGELARGQDLAEQELTGPQTAPLLFSNPLYRAATPGPAAHF